MNCPKCAGPSLSPVVVDGIEVDRCPSCEGIWFDKRELTDLLESNSGEVREILGGEDAHGHDQSPGTCPRDGGKLLRVRSSRNREVTLDCCVVCQGVWLDGGEFERIRAARPQTRLGDLL